MASQSITKLDQRSIELGDRTHLPGLEIRTGVIWDVNAEYRGSILV